MSHENNFEINGQNFFVKAAFFLFLFLPVCDGSDLGRLKFSTPCFHGLYWERYGE